MKSRMFAAVWALRAKHLFGQRRYLEALRAFVWVVRFFPEPNLPAIWQGYYALTLFYGEHYQQAIREMECALFVLRAIKTDQREAYWLHHEILTRLREATKEELLARCLLASRIHDWSSQG